MWHGPTLKVICTHDVQYLGCWLSSAEGSPVLLLSPLLTLIKFWFRTNEKHFSVIHGQHTCTKVNWSLNLIIGLYIKYSTACTPGNFG